VLGAFFFVPYALLTAELGSSFPAEGGAYVWVRLAFGQLAAAVTSVFYWLSNPIWLGGPKGFRRLEFELTQIVPLAVLAGLGVLFYALGRPTRERVVPAADPLAAAS
jgi:hypothetical protein